MVRYWKGMRDQAAVMRFCDADAGLVYAARQAGVLRDHWSPSGEAYYDDADVLRFREFLDDIRAERKRPKPPKPDAAAKPKPKPVVYRDERGHTLDLWLCESCERAMDRSGRCLGCSSHSRGR